MSAPKDLHRAQTKSCTGEGEQVVALQGLLTANDTIAEAGLGVQQNSPKPKEDQTNAP
jgi:hypothetical protein